MACFKTLFWNINHILNISVETYKDLNPKYFHISMLGYGVECLFKRH